MTTFRLTWSRAEVVPGTSTPTGKKLRFSETSEASSLRNAVAVWSNEYDDFPDAELLSVTVVGDPTLIPRATY